MWGPHPRSNINPYLQELSVDSVFLARHERDSVSTGSRKEPRERSWKRGARAPQTQWGLWCSWVGQNLAERASRSERSSAAAQSEPQSASEALQQDLQ